MSYLKWPDKDPQAVADYAVDWSRVLASPTVDTIVASSWAFTGDDALLVIASGSFSDTVATIWLSAGTAGASYNVTNHITTNGGRQFERTVTIKVRQR